MASNSVLECDQRGDLFINLNLKLPILKSIQLEKQKLKNFTKLLQLFLWVNHYQMHHKEDKTQLNLHVTEQKYYMDPM